MDHPVLHLHGVQHAFIFIKLYILVIQLISLISKHREKCMRLTPLSSSYVLDIQHKNCFSVPVNF